MSNKTKEIEKNWSTKPDNELKPSNSYINFEEITIIVPTLNEEEAISLVINDLQTQGFNKILVVDGFSTDATIEIVKKQKVDVINQKGIGKTGAIKTALEHVTTPYVALIDGDCTYGANDIEKLFHLIQNSNEVIGARKKGREHISRLNRFGNWLINNTFNLIFGTNLTDVCSGMYILSTEFAKKIPFKTKGFDVEVEIAGYASYLGKISEYPISFHKRLGYQKLRPLKDGFTILKSILQLGFSLYPTRVISLMTILLFFPGLVLLSYPFFISVFSYQLSSIIIGLIMIVIAIQGVTLYLVDTKVRNIPKKSDVSRTE
jgi:dolichol-phosphate mannosyltransferase